LVNIRCVVKRTNSYLALQPAAEALVDLLVRYSKGRFQYQSAAPPRGRFSLLVARDRENT